MSLTGCGGWDVVVVVVGDGEEGLRVVGWGCGGLFPTRDVGIIYKGRLAFALAVRGLWFVFAKHTDEKQDVILETTYYSNIM